MRKVIPLSEARKTLPGLVSKVSKSKRPVLLSRRGQALAVLISFSEYESWIETLELISDPQAVTVLTQGLSELELNLVHPVPDTMKALDGDETLPRKSPRRRRRFAPGIGKSRI